MLPHRLLVAASFAACLACLVAAQKSGSTQEQLTAGKLADEPREKVSGDESDAAQNTTSESGESKGVDASDTQDEEMDDAAELDKFDGHPSKFQEFMHMKLDASTSILEGLCLEDAELVKKGVVTLRKMTKIELWNFLKDAEYREHTRKYRENAARVTEAADEGDFNKAAQAWFDTTKSCLECHNDLRARRKGKVVTDKDSATGSDSTTPQVPATDE